MLPTCSALNSDVLPVSTTLLSLVFFFLFLRHDGQGNKSTGGGEVAPLRASNEHCLIVRVLRAQSLLHRPLCSSHYQMLLTCSALNSNVLPVAPLRLLSFLSSLSPPTDKNVFTGYGRLSLQRASDEHRLRVRGLRAHNSTCHTLGSSHYQMLLHLLRTQFTRLARRHHRSFCHNDVRIGKPGGKVKPLFNQQDGKSSGILKPDDHVLDVIDNGRLDAFRRLVQ